MSTDDKQGATLTQRNLTATEVAARFIPLRNPIIEALVDHEIKAIAAHDLLGVEMRKRPT